jgi:hypothetical protein
MTENDYCLLYDIASKRIEELEKENADQKDQLTKAKELLNEFMRIGKASDEDLEHDYSELIGETEQFLEKVK